MIFVGSFITASPFSGFTENAVSTQEVIVSGIFSGKSNSSACVLSIGKISEKLKYFIFKFVHETYSSMSVKSQVSLKSLRIVGCWEGGDAEAPAPPAIPKAPCGAIVVMASSLTLLKL